MFFDKVNSVWQKNNPSLWYNVFEHSMLWVTSGKEDACFLSPNFSAPETADAELNAGIAIYCIHGTADRSAAFSRVTTRILKRLPSPIVSITLCAFNNRGGSATIEDFAQQLIAKVQAKQHKNVIFIGHSRGGLVAAYAANVLAETTDVRVHSIITIGTPFGGSELAIGPLGLISKSISQMRPKSDFLTILFEKTVINALQNKFKLFCIAGKHDAIVSEAASIIKHDNVVRTTLPHCHLSLLHSHQVVAWILHFILQTTAPLSPTILLYQQSEQKLISVKTDFEQKLADVYFKINMKIDAFKENFLVRANYKTILLLENLHCIITDMLLGLPHTHYPQAKSLGELMMAYLREHEQKAQPYVMIIVRAYKYLNRFHYTLEDSEEFIRNLAKNYMHIQLPTQEPEAAPATPRLTNV